VYQRAKMLTKKVKRVSYSWSPMVMLKLPFIMTFKLVLIIFKQYVTL